MARVSVYGLDITKLQVEGLLAAGADEAPKLLAHLGLAPQQKHVRRVGVYLHHHIAWQSIRTGLWIRPGRDVELAEVREVLDLCAITRVPRTPDFMKGVVNLRGTVIPVIDLRLRFGMTQTESTIDARIVVIEFNLDGNDTVAGILTDSVHDVIGIDDDRISPPPETGSRWRTEYIKGIGKYGDDFILLLDIHRVISEQEKASVAS